MQGIPLDEGVQASSVVRVGRYRFGLRVRVDVEPVPHVVRLVRVRARPANLSLEQAARGQCLVAHHLSRHAKPRELCQQQIARILFQRILAHVGLLTVRR